MKFSFYERDSLGIAGITATSEHYDAIPPISTVRFDFDIRKMNRDRFAVASVLFFSEFCSGPLNFGEGVSPEVASAIEGYLSDRGARVTTVEYEPYASATGVNVIDISSTLRSESPTNAPGETRTIFLDVLPGDRWFGSISHIDHIITSTNGHIVATNSNTRNFEISVATALSFCDLYYADSIRVSQIEGLDSSLALRVSQLLASCNSQLILD